MAAEARLAETESRLLQQADEIQSRLRSLMASEEGVAEKLARIHEQELALARRSATLDVQAATTRTAPPAPVTAPQPIPVTATPEVVARATQRQAEEEARLAQREARLEREASELQARADRWLLRKRASPSDWPKCTRKTCYSLVAAPCSKNRLLPLVSRKSAPRSRSRVLSSATPEFVTQAALRQAEEEARLAQREARLEREASELQARAKAMAASEDALAQRLAKMHEKELGLARRGAVLDEQAAATSTAQIERTAAKLGERDS